MKPVSFAMIIAVLFSGCTSTQNTPSSTPSTYSSTISGYQKYDGFMDFYWDDQTGKILLEITNLEEELLYVNYLSAGVGSNDIGLDRGQIGDNRVVKFIRSGNKILMIQPNYSYRAESDNPNEVQSVEEAFAQSVLHGFKIEKEENGRILIDFTDFLISDAHGVSKRLKQTSQGSYSLDKSRSAIYLDRTKNFKDNSEFEAMLTFKGNPSGGYIRSVTPSPEAVTVRVHHSLVRLPDDGFEMRKFDPRSGYYGYDYQDYATPIEESLVKRFIVRHRLKKKDPTAAKSEAVEPIIYYVDKGAPEPIKSALIVGAQWWNEAFEKAGYIDAFQVKVLPDSADPLDINYNVIQWVHRSTRGWSYGGSVIDPRTGEILKGHVSLGSLRIRQDFLIATGLLQPFEGEKTSDPRMLEMALARLRQLSAHEVGHTLGLYHNFAASTNDRASVMDYPHPKVTLDENGEIDLSDAYDVGIGEWDVFAIRYGYEDIPGDENSRLNDIINEWIDQGYHFITDADARPKSGAHSLAHLWDNGENAAQELQRLKQVRNKVLNDFSEAAIQTGEPVASIEEVLVPVYFMHRFQVEAAAKLVGGMHYAYKAKGDDLPYPEVVPANAQNQALSALTETLQPDFLSIPSSLRAMLSPKAPGFGRTRESFKSNAGPAFDPVAAAETSAEMTLTMLFNSERLERLVQQSLLDNNLPGADDVFDKLIDSSWKRSYTDGLDLEIKIAVEKRILYHLMNLVASGSSTESVRSIAYLKLIELAEWIKKQKSSSILVKAHYQHALFAFEQFLEEPDDFKLPKTLSPPDGSPIGMDCLDFLD